MRAMTWVVVGLCVVVATYMYVMALCYLCDLHEEKKRAKHEAEEKRRRQELQRAFEQVEMQRKHDVEQRKRLAEERRLRAQGWTGFKGTGTSSAVPS
ncbi:MAG: hypothetical protein HY801_03630 [Candidatus Lindowbacteria bacterium]|nr:hypothetical protein [Candidatus Lindowbacteria bacterium]